MLRIKGLLLVGVALFFATITIGKDGIEFQNLSLSQGLAKAKAEGKMVFIDLYATWCGPCKYLSKSIFVDKELGNFMNENFISLKLDGEKADGARLMANFDLSAYPTMLFLSPEKELKKKIVGVVSAENIKESGYAVLHPETTVIYKLEKKYKSGDRASILMKEYIKELVIEGRDTDLLISEYLKLHPRLDLVDAGEFLIFALGIKEKENRYMKEFLRNAAKYNLLHSELSESKINEILLNLVTSAIEANSDVVIDQHLDSLYGPYKIIFGTDAFDKRELKAALKKMYKDG